MGKISVVVPIYKVEKFLRQCLDSIVNQTYRDLEIILVDDGSPDRGGVICDEYAQRDDRIKVIHKPNGGLSAARNDALKLVTGEWISFVDSDDWCELTMYEKAIKKAEETNADIVMFNHYVNNKKAETVVHSFAKDFVSSDPRFIAQLLLCVISPAENPLPAETKWSQGLPWDKLFKASLILDNDLQFAENVKAEEDRIFNIHAFRYAQKVCFIDETLYHWRVNSGSIGHQYNPNRITIDLEVNSEFLSIGQKYGLPKEYYQAVNGILAISTVSLGWRYFFNPQNKMPLSQQIKEANKVIHQEPRWTSLQTVEKKQLTRAAKLALLWRKNPIFMIYVVSLLQKGRSKYSY